MKRSPLFLAFLAVSLAFAIEACQSPATQSAPSSRQQLAANAVEDAISIGLVPVLTKNPAYLATAQGMADALGAFSGSTLTPSDVSAFLAKTGLSADDQRTVAGIVNAAWGAYLRRYADAVNASTRPDVKLFLSAVASGINSAVAAVPR